MICNQNCNQGRGCDCKQSPCTQCKHVRRIWRGITPRWVCQRFKTAAPHVRCEDFQPRKEQHHAVES